jgi:hypothetical protein
VTQKTDGDTIRNIGETAGIAEEEQAASGGIEQKIEEKYDPSQIIIKYRPNPQDTTIDVPRDFEHVPTLEELKETFGPGYYHLYTKIGEEKHSF